MSPHSFIHSFSFNKYWLSIYVCEVLSHTVGIQQWTKQVMFLPSWTGVNGKPLNTQDCFYMTGNKEVGRRMAGGVCTTLGRVSRKGFSKEVRFQLRFEDWEGIGHAASWDKEEQAQSVKEIHSFIKHFWSYIQYVLNEQLENKWILFLAKKDLHRKDEFMGDATSLEASYFHFLQPCFTSQTRDLAQALAFQDCRILSTHLPKGLALTAL